MKYEAVIYTEDGGYVTAMQVGGSFATEQEARQCAEHYLRLSVRKYQENPVQWQGPPFGSGSSGRVAGWPITGRLPQHPEGKPTTYA